MYIYIYIYIERERQREREREREREVERSNYTLYSLWHTRLLLQLYQKGLRDARGDHLYRGRRAVD